MDTQVKGKGVIIVLCGGQNTGKSAWIIDRLKKSQRRIFVFDRRREYLERLGKKAKQATLFYSLASFKKNINNMRYSNIVFEEATTFLKASKEDYVSDALSGIFHNGNVCYMVFHTIRGVPLSVLDLCHYVVVFNTGEDISHLRLRRPKMFNFISKVKKRPCVYKNQ